MRSVTETIHVPENELQIIGKAVCWGSADQPTVGHRLDEGGEEAYVI